MTSPQGSGTGTGSGKPELEPTGVKELKQKGGSSGGTATPTPTATATVPVTPTVTTENQLDAAGVFGGFDRRFRWRCSPGASGYIVQRIDRVESVLNSDESQDASESNHATYWEAWQVIDSVVMAPDGLTPLDVGSHDSWVSQPGAGRHGKHGAWSMHGTVCWLAAGATEIGRFRAGAVPAAAGLLATSADPGITGNPILSHSRSGVWDARTAEAACGVLVAELDSEIMTVTNSEDAIADLIDTYGFASTPAAAGVRLFLDRGHNFPLPTTDESDQTSEDT